MKRSRQSLTKWEFKVRNKELEFKIKNDPTDNGEWTRTNTNDVFTCVCCYCEGSMEIFSQADVRKRTKLNFRLNCILKLLSNMYKWFKVLLWDKPMFVKSKLYSLGMIYLSIITPDDVNTTTAFDQFLSFEINFSSK